MRTGTGTHKEGLEPKILREIAACRLLVEQYSTTALRGTLSPQGCQLASQEAEKLRVLLTRSNLPTLAKLAAELARVFAGGPAACQSSTARFWPMVEELNRRLALLAPQTSNMARLRVIAVVADAIHSAALAGAGQEAGVVVEVMADLTQAANQIRPPLPDVVLVDGALSGGQSALLRFVESVRERSPELPIVAWVDAENWDQRYRFAQAGVQLCYRKGFVASSLIRTLITLSREQVVNKPRVLLGGADNALVEGPFQALKSQGFLVTREGAPANLLARLSELHPDLFLLDDGNDGARAAILCRAIRAEARWRSLPIIILGKTHDAETVVQALAGGADGQLPRDLSPELLASAVLQRCRRTLAHRSAGYEDPLTGTDSHYVAEARLRQLLTLAERQHHSFSLLAVGIDGLDELRRSRGAAIGDDAVYAVAQFLAREFRGQDVISRGDGSDLLVGMLSMTHVQAGQRMSEVSGRMARNLLAGPLWSDVRLSLSAGIAEYPTDGDEFATLQQVASSALRDAQSSGGNRVRHGRQTDTVALVHHVDIVVVDEDEDANLRDLLKALQDQGWDVQWMQRGAKAVEALTGPTRSIITHVAIIATALSDMRGLEVLTQLRKEVIVKQVFLASSSPSGDELVAASRLGVSDFLAKPYDIERIVDRIAAALANT